MSENSEALSDQLRARRKELSLTQAEAADLAGVSERSVRSIERGKTTAQLDVVLALADALGLQLHLSVRGTNA